MEALAGLFSRSRRTQLTPPEVTPAPSAQLAYKRMLDAEISPALRALGLKGSAGAYELPSTTHWALLAFQKSMYSNRESILFTVNLCAIRRDAWQEAGANRTNWPKRPSANTYYGAGFPQGRIGLIAGREDTWWTIAADAPTAPVASAVLHAIEHSGIPWLRSELSRSA